MRYRTAWPTSDAVINIQNEMYGCRSTMRKQTWGGGEATSGNVQIVGSDKHAKNLCFIDWFGFTGGQNAVLYFALS